MKNVAVYVEQIPEYFKSEMSITISCKRSESQEAQAIIDYLSSIINVTYRRQQNEIS
jgi:hypothetical protein